MTDFLLTSVQDGTLTLLLLKFTATSSDPKDLSSGSETPSTITETIPLLEHVDVCSEEAFHPVLDALHRRLLVAFHEHWRYLSRDELHVTQRPTVMDFERIFANWRTELVRWLRRGRIAGWWDDRGLLELDQHMPGRLLP